MVRDNASPVLIQVMKKNYYIVPYEGMKLSAITSFNAGTRNLGLEINYYSNAPGTFRARTNEVSMWKCAVYRRGAPEDERPIAGTIREPGQTVYETGAHFIPTGWQIGYQIPENRSPTGEQILVPSSLNPNSW